jgi:hypothetical protein
MSIALSTLVTQLQALVPASDGVPSTAQYQSAVKQAVADFSRRTTQQTQTTIDVVASTATYALPDDFLLLISFKREGDACGNWRDVWETGAYGWPIWGYSYNPYCDPCDERYTIRGGQITIHPTPDTSETRVLRYGWKHILNASDEYEYLDEDSEAVRILLLKAQAEATRVQATAESSQGTKVRSYRQGDVSVDMNAQDRAKALNNQVRALEDEYMRAITAYNQLAPGWCG